VPSTLTLPEALDIAKESNPSFRAAQNDLSAADWAVRSAYGDWLPSADISTGASWQGSGEQNIGGFTSEDLGITGQPSYYFSNYRLGAQYSMNGRTLLAPGQAKAQRSATVSSIDNAAAQLAFAVTQAYLGVLRQEEGLALALQELERAQLNLRLAQGQLEIGTATRVEVTQAEVAVGRAQVGVLQAENAVRTTKLRLTQQLGLEPSVDYALTSDFELAVPEWSEDQLRSLALSENPQLAALRANESSAEYGVKMARSSYFPTLSLSAGYSGFARQASNSDFAVNQARSQVASQQSQCEDLNAIYSRLANPLPLNDCSAIQLTPAGEQAIRSQNEVFPFDFTNSPPTLGLTISVPIFQGLSRQRQVEDARVQRDDLRYQVREQELQLSADIAAALGSVRTAYETARIEERNQVAADEQLRLAQEQYRLGAQSFLQLVEAETLKAQADRALVDAVFTYHENLASLEATVGTSLRER